MFEKKKEKKKIYGLSLTKDIMQISFLFSPCTVVTSHHSIGPVFVFCPDNIDT